MTIAPGWIQSAPAAAPGWAPPLSRQHLAMTLGDLPLSTDGREWEVADAIIGVRELEGWWEDAPDATESFAHPTGDGTIDGYLRRGARTITLHGHIVGKTPRAALEMVARLKRVPRLTRLVVDERAHGLEREAAVRIVAITPERVDARRFRLTITLHAPDPLLYSTAVVDLANGANALVNRGSETARPTLEVVGPHSALTLTHPAGSITLASTPSGTTRVVDMRRRLVWQAGVRVDGVLTGTAVQIPAGGASITVSGKGAGALRARKFEAFP